MRETERKQERKRLDFEMRSYRNAGRAKNPTQGLLAAIRLSLRIPVSEIAGNARVNRSGVYDFEASERRRTITLKSMAKIADAMGCKVVYGIVPKGGKTLEQLRREADIRVGRNAAKLAELLTDSALKGDLNSTKTLVGWAEKKKPVAAVKKGTSFLERLTKTLKSQGDWKGPMDEKLGEVGEGGVEPENSGQ